MTHLEELLKAATLNDKTRRTPLNRRFIIIEGIYKHSGGTVAVVFVLCQFFGGFVLFGISHV